MLFLMAVIIPSCFFTYCIMFGVPSFSVPAKRNGQVKPPKECAHLSAAAQDVYAVWKALPAASRPDAIVPVLEALDVKYKAENTRYDYDLTKYNENQTHTAQNRYRYGYSARPQKPRPLVKSGYNDYYKLWVEFSALAEDLKKQERALELAGIQGNLDLLDSILERVKDEREITQAVTKEISK